MAESLKAKLEASRKELLDLGMRNSLLNFKQLKSKGLHVVDEQSASIFRILVLEGKAMTFLSREDVTGNGEQMELLPAAEQEVLLNDTKLQTNESEKSLMTRLLNTFYAAKTSYEEQGVNILYIALGMLHWFESDSSQEERLAPLVLIPVHLDRSNIRERVKVKYSTEEFGENISLRAKMRAEFGIEIPEIGTIEEFDISAYFKDIADAVSCQARWRVAPDQIELGFFSFNKFLIYNDLDNSKWPDNKKPVDHPLLQGLFERGFQDSLPGPGDDAFIDTDTKAGEFFQVVDADSSQIHAMIAARAGKNLLIQGPPGTGKSQTITNLIADAVGQGKRVLFVAEKMAALNVVKTKLDSINLGELCLELHSNKSNKKELHAELMRIIDLGRPSTGKLEQEIDQLGKNKAELNNYCQAVNRTIPKGQLTVTQLIGRLLAIDSVRQGLALPTIDKLILDLWDADTFRRAQAFAERIQARLPAIGVPVRLLFWGCRLSTILPGDQETLLTRYKEAAQSIAELCAILNEITDHLGIPTVGDRLAAEGLAEVCGLAAQAPPLEGMLIMSDHWQKSHSRIEEVLDCTDRLKALQTQYKEILLPTAWSENMLDTRRNIQVHGGKWYKFLIGDYKRARNHLSSLCRETPPNEQSTRIQYVDDIIEAQQCKNTLAESESLATELFGSGWQGVYSDILHFRSAATYLYNVYSAIQQKRQLQVLLSYLSQHEDPNKAREFSEALLAALQEHKRCTDNVLKGLSFDESRRFPKGGLLLQPLEEQAKLIAGWEKNPNDIQKVVAWNVLEEVAEDEKLAVLTKLAVSWEPAERLLVAIVEKSWYEYLLESALRNDPALRQFQRDSHEEVVQQFRKLDKLSLEYNRARVATAHWEGLPDVNGNAGGQVNVLKREFNKKARFKPIRQVVEEAGVVLQAIKPVFMMSPLSIANFLPPGVVEFDLVIFDEASQVKPVEALGAILRGKQILVVGDTKQLPPTNFFDSVTDETDDEENVTADIQSILGLCHAQGLGSRMLRWHYRSRHESLITLSNHEFYDNKLVIFPSPGSRQQLGLRFRHLKDTIYDRGKTRTNVKEAQAVAEAVLHHASTCPHLSLGVVAFSSAQREAINDALELLRKKDSTTENFFNNRVHEPFFVKNLENVQGDERDVIFISIGYGRAEGGYVAMSFGPLNAEGGERRLNVLITRAKLRCEVFTNLTSDDIDLARTPSRGVAALKSFLYYAQHGRLSLTEETGRPADSPFEENVADRLTSLGYIVRQQVGSQGFYIDLVIVDPENPGRYVIGIECDGAAYHSARSARDRDRLRQEVLEKNGWKLHRIWSTDWFRHPDEELRRTVQAIEMAREQLKIDDQEYDADKSSAWSSSAPPIMDRELNHKMTFTPPKYKVATLPPNLLNAELHTYPIGKLADCVRQVVQLEGPVHFDEMAQRITDAAGVARIGSRIRDTLERAVGHLKQQKIIHQKGEFLWKHDVAALTIRDRSDLPNGSRKLKYIPPEEIAVAIRHVVDEALAISMDETAALVVRLFGFNRLTEEMRGEIAKLINKAIHDKIVRYESNYLKPVE